MAIVVGQGDFRYEPIVDWVKLPDGVNLVETPGVAVNSRDEVFALTRNVDHPVMVFDRDGTSCVPSGVASSVGGRTASSSGRKTPCTVPTTAGTR